MSRGVSRYESTVDAKLQVLRIDVCSLCVITARKRGPDMTKLQMPPPLPIDWKMKDISTAETNFGELDDGRLELRIKHDTLHGVTPAMLVWWFQHIDGTMSYRGEKIPMYRIWHPRDHIRVRILKPAPKGAPGFSEGAIIEINERTIEPERFVTRVVQMDMTGINLIAHKGPIQFGNLRHTFTETPEGTLYQSRLVLGSTIPVFGKILTAIVKKRIFTPEMGRAWFKHNIEDVGNFEFFLPSQYAEHGAS